MSEPTYDEVLAENENLRNVNRRLLVDVARADALAHIIDDLREHAARNGTRSAAWERVHELTRGGYVQAAIEAAQGRVRASWGAPVRHRPIGGAR